VCSIRTRLRQRINNDRASARLPRRCSVVSVRERVSGPEAEAGIDKGIRCDDARSDEGDSSERLTMDALQAIMTRRSIRRFAPGEVDETTTETLLHAAMAAPSAGNQQSWRFVVVRDRERLARLSRTSPYAGMLAQASLAIVVCGETAGARHEGFWVEDCSAAMENLLLAAHAVGLGAVWLGYHPDAERVERVRDELLLPETVVPLGIAAIGHVDEEKPPADRFEPTFVHHEVW
jgi:nitroreductase